MGCPYGSKDHLILVKQGKSVEAMRSVLVGRWTKQQYADAVLQRMPRCKWLTPWQVWIACGLPGQPKYDVLRQLAFSGKLVRRTRDDFRGRKRVGYCRP